MPIDRFFEKCHYCGGCGMHGTVNGEPCPLGVQEAISHRYSARDFPATPEQIDVQVQINKGIIERLEALEKQAKSAPGSGRWETHTATAFDVRSINGDTKGLWVAEVLSASHRIFYVAMAATAEDARTECGRTDLKASDFKQGGLGVTVAKFVHHFQQEPSGLGKNPGLGEAR